MKRFLLVAFMCLTAALTYAQEPADALRFSWTAPGGTARNQAVGGAMGSLGGDVTAVFVNPAGLAFYKTGDIVFTPVYHMGKTKASYLNRTEKDQKNSFAWGTTGVVLGSGNQGRNNRNTAVSIAFTRSADFNNNTLYRGANNSSSYSQKFLEEIGNGNIKDANKVASDFPFGTSLAFNTFWIDTVAGGSSGNFDFKTRAPFTSGLIQEQMIETRGGISEIALGGAVSKHDKFMFGVSLGVPILRYERNSMYTEADATDNTNNNFDFATVREELSTKGLGFNLKAGMIFKPQEYWRVGLAFHTPTLYSLTDLYQAEITTDTENYQGRLTDYSIDYTNGGSSEFKYTLITPYRAIGSISYVLREIQDVRKQRGFLTADVEYVNYKSSSFMEDEENGLSDASTKEYLKSLNRAIDKAYKGAFNFRVGGELKFTTLMVRLGAAYYGNPYQNINGEKGNRLNLSGGLGYRNQGFFVDLTYVHAMQKDVHFPYRLENRALYSGARLKSTVGNALMTVGFKF
ncbi:MAG TPA: aromatic hydrocarbon degradation protein [Chitinophagaceae bacterium]|jgi:hypothetical protein|nr:aromatic hydrocarbon degradation protein [Chitinophagaceae bacterium]